MKGVYDFNLHDSATCIWKLEKDAAYQLVAKHFVKGDANRKSLTMDYVLINIP